MLHSPCHHVSDVAKISVTLPLVALTTLSAFINIEGSSGLPAGPTIPSGFTCPLEQSSGKSPPRGPRWRGLASCAVQLCPSLGPVSLHLCTQLSIPCMWPPWGPPVQSAPPPRFRLIEKMDGESQFRMISLGCGVGEAQGWGSFTQPGLLGRLEEGTDKT